MRGDAAWRARGHAAKARACSSQGSPHGQAAKAKAWPHGQAAKAKARSQGQGSPHGQAAKAKACLRACCHGQGQGHGSPHGQAAKAKARSQGLGMLAWARWHALGTPTRPWQHLGGLLLPSLDSLFGHLQLFPP
jgi:hypothetical protein